MTPGSPTEGTQSGSSTLLVRQGAQILRFLLVGGSAVTTDLLVYLLLTDGLGLAPSPAKAISFVAGAVVSFVFNRGFVFRATGSTSRQILLFTLLYLTTLGLNTGVNAALLVLGAPRLLAWFVATGTSTVANFVGMKWSVFRSRHADP